ncbi:Immune-associated nucleotide-binding protein 10 [Bulinus truncatus]|nr:Immune-associated nucleotide-binding protein 10 [Bulinus truncatus]
MDIVDHLFENEVITMDDKERISQGTTKLDRNDKLLHTLLSARSGHTFDVFYRSLEKDYSDVLKYINDRQDAETEKNSRSQAGVMSTNKEPFDIDLLLLGKTGNGKSSTGNSILKKEVFKTGDNLNSTTKNIQCEHGMFNGRKIEVVDGPGFEDTEYRDDQEKSTEMMIEKMGDAILEHPEGYHAFIFVLKYGGKLTKEDKNVIEMLKEIFGPNVIKDYCILLLTYRDNFKSNKANKNKKFKQWRSEQTDIFKDLLMECGNRVVLFDNNTEDPKIKDKQLKKLIDKIDNLQYHGRRYCDKNFKEAEERRKLLLLKHQTERITVEIRQETSKLMERIKNTNDFEPVQQIQELRTISEECKILTKKLMPADDSKSIFQDALCIVSNLKSFIASNLKTANKQRKKQEIEEKRRQLEDELLIKIKKLHEKSTLGEHEKRTLKQQIESIEVEIQNYKSEVESFNKDIATLTTETNPSLEKITNESLRTFFERQNKEKQILEQELEERTATFWKRLKSLFKGHWRSKTSTATQVNISYPMRSPASTVLESKSTSLEASGMSKNSHVSKVADTSTAIIAPCSESENTSSTYEAPRVASAILLMEQLKSYGEQTET